MEEKHYYGRLDFLKGLAMFLVIVGHCIQCGSGMKYNQSQAFFDNHLFRLIYSFHMPLFMIISGFLFARTASGRPFTQTLKTKSIRLLLPIFVWQTMMMLLSVLRGSFNIHSYLTSLFEGFWFLWAAWWATVVCAIVECSIVKTSYMKMIVHSAIVLLTLLLRMN